jgi:hypothetical protein
MLARLDSLARESDALRADLQAIATAADLAARQTAEPPALLSMDEAADVLGLGSVRALLDDGALDDRYIGRRRLVTRASIDALITGNPAVRA